MNQTFTYLITLFSPSSTSLIMKSLTSLLILIPRSLNANTIEPAIALYPVNILTTLAFGKSLLTSYSKDS
jgi:hypothetical protein